MEIPLRWGDNIHDLTVFVSARRRVTDGFEASEEARDVKGTEQEKLWVKVKEICFVLEQLERDKNVSVLSLNQVKGKQLRKNFIDDLTADCFCCW